MGLSPPWTFVALFLCSSPLSDTILLGHCSAVTPSNTSHLSHIFPNTDVGKAIGAFLGSADNAQLASTNKELNKFFGGDNSVDYASVEYVIAQMKRDGTSPSIEWDDWRALIEVFGTGVVQQSRERLGADNFEYDPCRRQLVFFKGLVELYIECYYDTIYSMSILVKDSDLESDSDVKTLHFTAFPPNMEVFTMQSNTTTMAFRVSFNSNALPQTMEDFSIENIQITAQINWNDFPPPLQVFVLHPIGASEITLPFLEINAPALPLRLYIRSHFDMFFIDGLDRIHNVSREHFKAFNRLLPTIAPTKTTHFTFWVAEYAMFSTIADAALIGGWERFFDANISHFAQNFMSGPVFELRNPAWVPDVEFILTQRVPGLAEDFWVVDGTKWDELSISSFERTLDLALLPWSVDRLSIENSCSGNVARRIRKPTLKFDFSYLSGRSFEEIYIDTHNIEMYGSFDWNSIPDSVTTIDFSGDGCLGRLTFPFLTDPKYDFHEKPNLKALYLPIESGYFSTENHFEAAAIRRFLAEVSRVAPVLTRHSLRLLEEMWNVTWDE